MDNEQLQAILVTDIWQKIHSAFANEELIKEWTKQNWTYGLVQEWAYWLKDKFNPQDYDFATWVRDFKELDWWDVRDKENNLRTEFQTYQTEQLIARIEINPQ